MMPDNTGGVGGFHVPGTPGAPKGPQDNHPTGDIPKEFKGLMQTKQGKNLNLTSDQMSKIQDLRSQNGFSGEISPLEEWFMEHSQGNPIEGIMMYMRFMNSMMMTCVTTMSSVSKAVEQRQKEQDRQAYGGMA